MATEITKKFMHRYNTDPVFNAKCRERNRSYKEKLKTEIFSILGGYLCRRCGFNDPRALHIDHVNGGGHRERQIITSKLQFLNAVKNNPEKYQVLCANCNWIKRIEENENRKLR